MHREKEMSEHKMLSTSRMLKNDWNFGILES